ncbi:integrase core domain-containing protein, partial [Escherichia coli]|uniref:IS3 family transposase n=1 Tax=Escherichia coli TaxID=562 RepID=UPI00345ADCC1
FCTGVAEKYALIEQWRQQFPIEAMCQVFGVSRSGYYNWVQHEPSDRKQSDERLKLEIKVAHIRTRETYGTRRLQTELAENGIIVGRDRLARLRKELRLRCKQKRKFRATTNSNHNLPVAPNLLNQTFAPTARYDNAPMESFWGTLKNESLSHYRFNNRDEAISVIREYIEIFYNRQRRHSRLGNISPAAFREKYHQMAA